MIVRGSIFNTLRIVVLLTILPVAVSSSAIPTGAVVVREGDLRLVVNCSIQKLYESWRSPKKPLVHSFPSDQEFNSALALVLRETWVQAMEVMQSVNPVVAAEILKTAAITPIEVLCQPPTIPSQAFARKKYFFFGQRQINLHVPAMNLLYLMNDQISELSATQMWIKHVSFHELLHHFLGRNGGSLFHEVKGLEKAFEDDLVYSCSNVAFPIPGAAYIEIDEVQKLYEKYVVENTSKREQKISPAEHYVHFLTRRKCLTCANAQLSLNQSHWTWPSDSMTSYCENLTPQMPDSFMNDLYRNFGAPHLVVPMSTSRSETPF